MSVPKKVNRLLKQGIMGNLKILGGSNFLFIFKETETQNFSNINQLVTGRVRSKDRTPESFLVNPFHR